MRRTDAGRRRQAPVWTWTWTAMLGLALLGGCGRGAPTKEPEPISADSPFRYPIQLWDKGVEGQTVLMVHVTNMGAVDTAYVQQSSGQAAFDSAALAGVGQLLFSPARKGKDQQRIASWVRLPVRFSLSGGPGPADAVPPDSATPADSAMSPDSAMPPDSATSTGSVTRPAAAVS